MKQPTRSRGVSTASSLSLSSPHPHADDEAAATPAEVLGYVLRHLHRQGQAQDTAELAEIMTLFVIHIEKGLRITEARNIHSEHVRRFLIAPVRGRSGRSCRPTGTIVHLRHRAVRLFLEIARDRVLFRHDPTVGLPISDNEAESR